MVKILACCRGGGGGGGGGGVINRGWRWGLQPACYGMAINIVRASTYM